MKQEENIATAPRLSLFNEPKWVLDKRLSAWGAYQKEPLPDRVSHLWKYSDPTNFELNGREISLDPTKAVKLVFKLHDKDLNKGIVLIKLTEAFQSYNDLVLKTYGELTKNYPSRVTYLNEATWSNGYFLYIPKGVKVDSPIIVRLINDKSNELESIRVLIVLEEEANISLIDEITSKEGSNLFTNVVIEMFLGRGSKLSYLNLQNQREQTTHHLFQRATIGSHAELTNLIVALGGKISKSDLGAALNGIGGSVTTYGIVLGEGAQKFDHHTTIEHLAPYTRSVLNFRVALKDKAKSAYTGNLKIINEAIKSDAYQENRNLLLSDQARADSIPELEILTNDVIRCSHGVTVGQVDKDQIYYLMSRGLSQKDAEKIITLGFLEPTISRIPSENLKEEILLQVKNKLENL